MNLIDAALLILATAVGLCAIRPFLDSYFQAPIVPEADGFVRSWWAPRVLLTRAVLLEAVLMAWTVAWAVLQLRQPRPALRRLSRQPGFVATASAAAIVVLSGPVTAAILRYGQRPYPVLGGYSACLTTWCAVVSVQIGAAVLAGWILLAIAGRCHRVGGWLELPGRVLGSIWLLMMPANLLLLVWYMNF